MAGVSTLRDNFTDNSISTSAWVEAETGSATADETSGQIRFTLPSSTAGTHIARLTSRYTYDLTSDSFYVNIQTMVATGVAATAFFQLYLDGTNALQWIQLSNTLTARTLINGTSTNVYSVTWNASTYKYLRIRADTTTIYWDSSTDGITWTNRATATIASLGFPITDLFVDFGATCGNIASPGSLRLDDVNLILPALSTNWRYQWARWSLTNRHKRVTIAIDTANTVQGYLVTADGVDASGNPSGNVRYWSGPAGAGRVLTSQPDQASAEAMAVNLPLNGSFDLPEQIDARYFRLYDRSIDGNAFAIREYYPRRLVQADDIEAESIRAVNIAAGAITVDKLFATLTITGKNIQTAYNGARVVMSGDAFGGLVTYDDDDTYSTTAGTGTYQILLSLADGKLYGGNGAVVIWDEGIDFNFDVNPGYIYLKWYDDGVLVANAGVDSLVGENRLILNAYNSTGSAVDASIQLVVDKASPALSYIDFELDGYNSTVITKTGINTDTLTAFVAVAVTLEDAVTASRTVLLDLSHNSSGTPATNFGSTIRWFLESSTTPSTVAARQIVDWEVATHASRSARMIFQMTDSAADREVLRLVATGAAPAIGFLGAGAVVRQTIGAAAPAGGTGATAGAYDTAANRNAMITLVNNIRTALINLGLAQT